MFVQVIQGKCTRQEQLRAQVDKWSETLGPTAEGWLGGTYGFTDDDMFVAVVRFESREAARANSDRPEQSSWWAETERCFDGPVEFHDADKVVLMLAGSSDDAGFVQVIRGKIDNRELLESEVDEMAHVLHEERPEIIGATLAIEDDGTFTETVFFTSEAEARQGEQKAIPMRDDVRHLYEDWNRMTHDATYLDLHRPWFASRGAAAGR